MGLHYWSLLMYDQGRANRQNNKSILFILERIQTSIHNEINVLQTGHMLLVGLSLFCFALLLFKQHVNLVGHFLPSSRGTD